MTGELNRFNFCSVFSPFCKHIYSSVLDNCIMLSATLSVPLSILDRVSFIGYSHFCPIQFIRAFEHLLPPLHICKPWILQVSSLFSFSLLLERSNVRFKFSLLWIMKWNFSSSCFYRELWFRFYVRYRNSLCRWYSYADRNLSLTLYWGTEIQV